MNHDYAHCLDYTTDCPKECFRAQLQKDIEENRSKFIGIPMTYAHLGDTEECKLVKDKNVSNKVWTGEWIPVSERLPDEDRNVLVTVHFLGLEIKHKTGWNDHIKGSWYVDIASQIDGEWTSASDEYKVAKNRHIVTAWMPLPNAWKGDEDEQRRSN